jgi:hypothetical protein
MGLSLPWTWTCDEQVQETRSGVMKGRKTVAGASRFHFMPRCCLEVAYLGSKGIRRQTCGEEHNKEGQ